jgi:hypothetical protein
MIFMTEAADRLLRAAAVRPAVGVFAVRLIEFPEMRMLDRINEVLPPVFPQSKKDGKIVF